MEGEEAGRNAARRALGTLPDLKRQIYIKPGRNLRYVVPQIISGEKPLTLYARVWKPAFNVRIMVGENIAIHKRVVKPPELVTINLTAERLRRLEKDKEEIVIDMIT